MLQQTDAPRVNPKERSSRRVRQVRAIVRGYFRTVPGSQSGEGGRVRGVGIRHECVGGDGGSGRGADALELLTSHTLDYMTQNGGADGEVSDTMKVPGQDPVAARARAKALVSIRC